MPSGSDVEKPTDEQQAFEQEGVNGNQPDIVLFPLETFDGNKNYAGSEDEDACPFRRLPVPGERPY